MVGTLEVGDVCAPDYRLDAKIVLVDIKPTHTNANWFQYIFKEIDYADRYMEKIMDDRDIDLFKTDGSAMGLTLLEKGVYRVVRTTSTTSYRDWDYILEPIREPISRAYIGSSSCTHPKKYINTAGWKRFLVCPDCKKDLGDAE